MISVAALGDEHSAAEVLQFCRPDDAPYGLTRVDESELLVLDAASAATPSRDRATRVTFASNGELVGYLSYHDAAGDLAVSVAHRDACLARIATLSNGPARIWIRGVTPADRDTLEVTHALDRVLAVCAMPLESGREVQPAAGKMIRAFIPGRDDAGVVRVLAAAYQGTADGGWDERTFAMRQRYPWFRADDLLVADDANGTVVGLHWLKRRDDKTGEVYNLAVHPAHAGQGIGAVLLQAGLSHLAQCGLTQVVLWVDARNTKAMTLYRSAGFQLHAFDVQLQVARH